MSWKISRLTLAGSWGAVGRACGEHKRCEPIRRGRQEIILTPGGKLLVWMDRLCPPVVNRLVARFG